MHASPIPRVHGWIGNRILVKNWGEILRIESSDGKLSIISFVDEAVFVVDILFFEG